MKIYDHKQLTSSGPSPRIKKLNKVIREECNVLSFSTTYPFMSLCLPTIETYYYLIPLAQNSWIFFAMSYLNRLPQISRMKRWNAAVGTADEIDQLAARRFARREQKFVAIRKELPESMPRLVACILARELAG